ncbi:MAG: lipid II flippase MurJ [Bacteroidia bacterium]
MQRRFVGNLLLLQSLNWLVKPLWIFGVDRLAQIQLGDVWYGQYFVIFSFGLLFNILLDFGLNNFVSARVGASGNPHEARSLLKLRLGLALLYAAMVMGLGLWQKFDPWLLALAAGNQILAGFVLFYRAVLQGRHHFKTDSIISVTDRLVAILVCAFLLFGSGFKGYQGVLVFLGAQTAGYLCALLLSVWLAFRRAPILESNISTGFSDLWKQTQWFALLAFAMSFFTRIDALFIKNLSAGGYAEAGLYAQSFRLLDAALIFSALISSMLLPLFSGMAARKESTDSLIWTNFRIVMLAALPAAVCALFFGPDILQILYKDTYGNEAELVKSAAIFTPLILSFIPMSLIHIFGTWLTANKQVKYLAISALLLLVVNAAGNYVLVPKYGALGAAWVCFITQSIYAAFCLWKSFNNKAFEFRIQRLIQVSIVLLLMLISGFILRDLLQGFYAIIAVAICLPISLWISGIFKAEIQSFFTKKN